MKKYFNSKPLRKLLRLSSIFTATLLLTFMVSSFKIDKFQSFVKKPSGPTTYLTCGFGTSYTSDVDYQLYYLGSPVAGGSGTICRGISTSIPVASDAVYFNVTGSALTYYITNASGGVGCTPCSANAGMCSTPSTTVPGLVGYGSTNGPINSQFDFN